MKDPKESLGGLIETTPKLTLKNEHFFFKKECFYGKLQKFTKVRVK